MKIDEAVIGTRVESLIDFSGVPCGAQGVIDEDYGTGVMVAWDLLKQPLPAGYRKHDGKSAMQSGLLRDGFDKVADLPYLKLYTAN